MTKLIWQTDKLRSLSWQPEENSIENETQKTLPYCIN